MNDLTMTVTRSPESDLAYAALAKLETLQVGEKVHFDPELPKPVVDILYSLLRSVDKAWTIHPPSQPKIGLWKRLIGELNYPVDMAGRRIPQTIVGIARIR